MRKYGLSAKDMSLKLNKLHVSGNVCGEYIEYTIAQIYRNTSQDDVHCTYSFPIPETATLTGFSISLGGKNLSAAVESREEVLRILQSAKDDNLNPISLESDEDEGFLITVGDVLPNETVAIKITYMDQLIYDDNLIRLIIPSVIDPTYINQETEKEIDQPLDFYLSLLVESYGEVSCKSKTHKIKVERQDETLRKITIEKGQTLEKDFVLDIVERNPRQADGIAYSYYDQEQQVDKAVLMMRFFPILPDNGMSGIKNYTFIMDMSESLTKDWIEETKNALLIGLRSLDEGDKFNIVTFGGGVNVFSSRGKVLYNKESLSAATEWIEDIETGHGTDVYASLREVLPDPDVEDHVPDYIFLFSDDMVENEEEVIEFVRLNIGDSRLFTVGMDTEVNSYFINKVAEVGNGMAEFVEEGQRVDDIIMRHFHRAHNPQLDVTSIDWGKMQIEKTYPGTISYLYDREPFTIFATVIGEIEGKVVVKGKIVGSEGEREHKLTADLDKLEIVENSKLIDKVWARKVIESLEERERKARGHEKELLQERILELSREYNMLSTATAYILIETLEDHVSGYAMQKIVPLMMNEKTMKLLSESFFLDDTRYSNDITIRETMAQKGISRQEALKVVPFERENLLRILAKYQQADGSFKDFGNDEDGDILETTLKSVLAFTAGNEPATIYLSNVNKAFSYIIKTIRNDETLLTERNLMLLSIAYELADGKRLIKEKTKSTLDVLFDRVEEGEFPSSLKEVETVIENTSPLQMKYIMAAAVNVSSSQISNLEEIFEKDIKSNISRIAEVALAKAL
ncbi:MAG: VIT and VWA domain-containing protein [Clostridiaceae bacterium]